MGVSAEWTGCSWESVWRARRSAFSSRTSFTRISTKSPSIEKRFAFFHKLLENKWYVDEIYEAVFVKPIGALSELIWKGFDVAVIDRIVVGFGRVSEWTGQTVRVIQTGSIQVYAVMLLLGIVVICGVSDLWNGLIRIF